MVTPTRTDPTPGSGGTAVRDTWLDGTWTYPLPLDASKLSLGKHTWELGVNDNAGNGNKVKFTFLVTTSFADVDALLTRCGTAGTIPAATVTVAAREARPRPRPPATPTTRSAAIGQLQSFAARPRGVANAEGARPADHATRRSSSASSAGSPDAGRPVRPRHHVGRRTRARRATRTCARRCRPATRTRSSRSSSSPQRSDGFRHPAIEDGHVLIQQLGRAERLRRRHLGLQLSAPSRCRDTPFTSAADLAKYKVIIGNSSVGLNTFRTAYTMKDGTVVNEQAAFEGYIRNGGGFVAIHGADDSMSQLAVLSRHARRHVPRASGQRGRLRHRLRLLLLGRADQRGQHAPGHGRPRRPLRGRGRALPVRPQAAPVRAPAAAAQRGHVQDGRSASRAPAPLEGGDHPITYCSNYKGGRMFAQVLGHNWQLFANTAWFQQTIREGDPDHRRA